MNDLDLKRTKLPRRLLIAARFFKEKRFLYTFIVLLALVTIMIFPFFPRLVVIYGKTDEVIYTTPLTINDEFEIRYIHSIHLTPVEEYYRVGSDLNIHLYQLAFDTYSVGMPSSLENGETLEMKDGQFIIRNMKRNFPYFDQRIGQVVSNHQLIYHSKMIQFSEIAPPGSWVRLQVKKLNLFELMEEGLSLE